MRKRGAFTLEQAIKKLTHDNAVAWDLNERGRGARRLSGPTSCCSRRTAFGRSCRRSRRTCRAARAAWCRRPRASRPPSSTAPWRFEDGEATGAFAGTGVEGQARVMKMPGALLLLSGVAGAAAAQTQAGHDRQHAGQRGREARNCNRCTTATSANLRRGPDGQWTGKATQNGVQKQVTISPKGVVTAR